LAGCFYIPKLEPILPKIADFNNLAITHRRGTQSRGAESQPRLKTTIFRIGEIFLFLLFLGISQKEGHFPLKTPISTTSKTNPLLADT